MKILFAVWELDPFFKIGGLGDVARALPGALKKLGADIRVMVPYYKVVKMGRNKKTKVGELKIEYAGKKETVEIWGVLHPYMKVPAYFLKNSTYLDTAISIDTWGFFDKAVVEILKNNILNWQPDIVHVNDCHCGLIPHLIKLAKLPIKTMLTIHNLAYQKKTSLDVIRHVGINPNCSKSILWETKEYQVNFLLEAITHSDIITTVSPTYAREILTEEFGCGFNEILKGMEGRIFGILNGIDIDFSHTTHDKAVKYPYGPTEKRIDGKIQHYGWDKGKRLNKEFLQKKLGLKVDNNIPMICFIGRIDAKQKGLDILHTMLRRIDQTQFEFVILGSGDADWEERYKWFSTFYPKHISCNFLFDDSLAHQIYAASDFIVIPSKYEPCGLIQMIAMLFGTIPIAHSTGGLKDSIKDGYNGFLFSKYDSEGLENKVMKAVDVWKNDRTAFEKIVQNAQATDFSWNKSAEKYLALYASLLKASYQASSDII
ncbi:glycogen synthase [Candidatus Microgenomates bacterium]|nr:MAG: glycogen synthase [Candidatus Microgenomates bacterium]